jgi:hypothetical protein
MNAALKEAPELQSAQKKAEENARTLWSTLSREKKNEIIGSRSEKAIQILKELLNESEGIFYKGEEEKKTFGEVLLLIVNRKRARARERHREKKKSETRSALATVADFLEGDDVSDDELAETEKLLEQENAVKAWHQANDESIKDIKKIRPIPKKAKANAKLILHQLNTGPSFTPNERANIKYVLKVMLSRNFEGPQKIESPVILRTSKRVKSATKQIFNRLKKNENVSRAVYEALLTEELPAHMARDAEGRFIKRKSPSLKQENTQVDKKEGPSIDWRNVDPENRQSPSPLSNDHPDIDIPEKPTIDWRNADPKTHGPKKKGPTIVQPDINILAKEKPKPNIDWSGVEKAKHQKLQEKVLQKRSEKPVVFRTREEQLRSSLEELNLEAEYKEAQKQLDTVLTHKGAFTTASTNAYSDLSKLDLSPSSTVKQEQEKMILKNLDKSRKALAGVNSKIGVARNAVFQLKSKLQDVSEESDRFKSIKSELINMEDHLNTILNSSHGSLSLEERMNDLENEAEKTLNIITIGEKHYGVGENVLYQTNNGKTIRVRILPTIKPGTYRVRNLNKEGIFFIEKENAAERLFAAPQAPKTLHGETKRNAA